MSIYQPKSVFINPAELHSGYYLSAPHRRVWASLNLALQQRSGIVTISGADGCGKSTLVNILVNELKKRDHKARLFDAKSQDKSQPANENLKFIVVDNAQLLTTQQFRKIYEHILQARKSSTTLMYLLAGSNELEQMIMSHENSDIYNEIILSSHLGLMNRDETEKFAKFQLGRTNDQFDENILETLLPEIYEKTSGNPEAINTYLQGLNETLSKLNASDRAKNKINSLSDTAQLSPAFSSPLNSIQLSANNVANNRTGSWFNSKSLLTVVSSYVLSATAALMLLNAGFDFQDDDNTEARYIKTFPGQTVVLNSFTQSKDAEEALGAKSVEPAEVAEVSIIAAIEEPPSIAEELIQDEAEVAANTSQIVEKKPVVKVSEAKQTIKLEKNKQPKFIARQESKGLKPKPAQVVITNKDNPLKNSEQKGDSNTAWAQLVSFSSERAKSEPEKNMLDEISLDRIVADFKIAYEMGDLAMLDRLFVKDARSNNIENKKMLKNEYRKLFSITRSRAISIIDVVWKKSDDQITGEGIFRISLYEKSASERGVYTGKITFNLKEANEKLKISGLFYNYQEI